MDMATVLKRSANVFMVTTLVKLVVRDLTAEVREDTATLTQRVDFTVKRSPYIFAGAATLAGVIAGKMLGNHRRATRA